MWRKKLRGAMGTFNKNPDKKGLEKVYSVLDKLVKRNIFHKNKVSRLKSRYSKMVADLTAKKDGSKSKNKKKK